MAPRRRPKGRLARPIFAPMPPPGRFRHYAVPPWPRPPPQWERYARGVLEILRTKPNERACIAQWQHQGRKWTSKRAVWEKNNLRAFLWNNRRDEWWVLNVRFVPGTWDHWTLWAEYRGKITEAEAYELRRQRLMAVPAFVVTHQKAGRL